MYLLLSYRLKEETIGYGGKRGFYNKIYKSIKNNDSSNSSIWEMNNHIGTHIDCPRHFFIDGLSITDYPVDNWMVSGEKIQLIDAHLTKPPLIGIQDVNKKIINKNVELLLIKTGYCYKRKYVKYWNSNPSLSPTFAKWIRWN